MFVSEIISYPELVAREKANLQKGMNRSRWLRVQPYIQGSSALGP